jgi:hypothetical protein
MYEQEIETVRPIARSIDGVDFEGIGKSNGTVQDPSRYHAPGKTTHGRGNNGGNSTTDEIYPIRKCRESSVRRPRK